MAGAGWAETDESLERPTGSRCPLASHFVKQ